VRFAAPCIEGDSLAYKFCFRSSGGYASDPVGKELWGMACDIAIYSGISWSVRSTLLRGQRRVVHSNGWKSSHGKSHVAKDY